MRVEAQRVERAAEALGHEIATAEPPAAPTLYLGVDGTGVPLRRGETAGRAGKQPAGSAKTREAERRGLPLPHKSRSGLLLRGD